MLPIPRRLRAVAGEGARFVLMSSAGVADRDLGERVSRAQGCVIGLLHALLPPHADNEDAADDDR